MSTTFPPPDQLTRSLSAPGASNSRSIPRAVNRQRSQSSSIFDTTPTPKQINSNVEFKPQNARQCYTYIQDLLESGEVDLAAIQLAAKTYKIAVANSLFAPLSCSIVTGNNLENYRDMCQMMIQSAKDKIVQIEYDKTAVLPSLQTGNVDTEEFIEF